MATTTSRTAGIVERLQASLARAKHWADVESETRDHRSCYARAMGILEDAAEEAIRDLNALGPALEVCPYCNRAVAADAVSCDSCGWVREG